MQRSSSSCSDTQQECLFERGQPWKRHGNASPCLPDNYAGWAEVRAATGLRSWSQNLSVSQPAMLLAGLARLG